MNEKREKRWAKIALVTAAILIVYIAINAPWQKTINMIIVAITSFYLIYCLPFKEKYGYYPFSKEADK